MKTKFKVVTVHKVNAVAPRLSDEDIDPIEKDDGVEPNTPILEGWLPWDTDDIEDIRRMIAERLPHKQQFILEAFLDGLNYSDICVTEKYWRYHFSKGIEFIKKELKV
jgi:DNA-directed RNA polymerase specialized sigma24 family protein